MKISRRTFLGWTGFITAFGGAGLYYLLSKDKSHSEKEKLKLAERITSGEILSRFDGLPAEEQKRILAEMDNYLVSDTIVGNSLKELSKMKDVKQVVDNSLSGKCEYDGYTNTLRYAPFPNRDKAKFYVLGTPVLFVECHEKIHAIQDLNSQWDKFETFFSSFVPQSKSETLEITYPQEKSSEFARDWLKKPDASYQESLEGFLKLWNAYVSYRHERNIIWEIGAHTAFFPYNTSEMLYDGMRKSGNYNQWLDKMARENFNAAFVSNIELLGMLGPTESAVFSGRTAESVYQFTQEVNKLKQSKSADRAYQAGIERQNKLLIDIQNISFETVRKIDSAYKRK